VRIYLTAAEMLTALEQLDGKKIALRTLAYWASNGILVPSARWDGKRGRYHPRLYTLSDLAKFRVIAWLRRTVGYSMLETVLALSNLERQGFSKALRPNSGLELRVTKGPHGRDVVAVVPGEGQPEMAVATGQYQLQLRLDTLVNAATVELLREAGLGR